MQKFMVNGYVIRIADSTGGKAGKGRNKTSSVHAANLDKCIFKCYRFNVGNRKSLRMALDKAVNFAKNN